MTHSQSPRRVRQGPFEAASRRLAAAATVAILVLAGVPAASISVPMVAAIVAPQPAVEIA